MSLLDFQTKAFKSPASIIYFYCAELDEGKPLVARVWYKQDVSALSPASAILTPKLYRQQYPSGTGTE